MIKVRNPMTYFMFAVFATMLYVASGYPEGARFMPLVVGVPAILLCVLQMFLDQRAAPSAAKDNRSEMEKAEERVSQMTGRRMEFDAAQIAPGVSVVENEAGVAATREFIIWGYIIGFVAGILLLGFNIAVPLFLLFYLRREARCSWARSAIYSAIGCGLILGGLTLGLKLQLHTGFLTSALFGSL
jgi:hypothetical protein